MHRTLTSFAGCLTALWSSLAAFPKRLAHKVCRRPWNAPPPCRQGLKVNIPARLFCGLFRWFFGAPEVHLHAYLHLKKPFQRRGADALRPFAFEGIRPHLEPNRASGKAFAGAIRLGHFYVVADKVGSLFLRLHKYGPIFFPQRHFAECVRLWPPRFNYTTYPPFQAYAVEGWWLDNLLKGGKLTRQTYLTLVAQVTVGFQKRLGDCKATERFLREEVVRDKPHI